jgi:hypothetical protein
MMEEIMVDEDDRFIYCEKYIDGCHIRYAKDKIFSAPDLPKNIHEKLVEAYKKMKEE